MPWGLIHADPSCRLVRRGGPVSGQHCFCPVGPFAGTWQSAGPDHASPRHQSSYCSTAHRHRAFARHNTAGGTQRRPDGRRFLDFLGLPLVVRATQPHVHPVHDDGTPHQPKPSFGKWCVGEHRDIGVLSEERCHLWHFQRHEAAGGRLARRRQHIWPGDFVPSHRATHLRVWRPW